MKLKAGIFWGGQDEQNAYQSASAILHKLDSRLFEPALFFVDRQQKVYPIHIDLFRKGSWSTVNPIDPQELKHTINFAFLELWKEASLPFLHTIEGLGIPYVGQAAALREPGSSTASGAAGGLKFSCLVIDQLNGTALALYPSMDAAAIQDFTHLQLEQIRAKSRQFYQQLDLGPFARIRGQYTPDDLLLFEAPQMAYPLTEGGYLEEDLAPYEWTAAQCCTYSILVSLQRRFRENPQQKTYQAIYEHLLSLSQGQGEDAATTPAISVLIGASGAALETARAAARYFTEVSSELTGQSVTAYECLSAKNNTELRLLDLTSPLKSRVSGPAKEDALYSRIKKKTEALRAAFLPLSQRDTEAISSLSTLDTSFAYLCLSGKYNSGFLQYALDEAGVPHSGVSLKVMQKIDRMTSVPGILEPGMVHLKSSVWCTERSGCTIMGHSLIEKDGQLITPARHQLLAMNDAEVQRSIQQALRTALAPCTMRAYVIVESYLRIFEDNSVQLSVVEVETTPLLAPDHVLFAHASDAGLDPKAVFNRLLDPIIISNLASQNFRSVPTMVNENEEESAPKKEQPEQPGEYSTAPQAEEAPGFFTKAWQNIRDFVTAPIFLRNLVGLAVAGLLFFSLINLFLGIYTRHGSAQIVVDNYLDQTFQEARRQARGKGLKAVITDSTFVIGMPPNMVIEQDPQPGSKVKKRRTVYLWVTGGQAPDVLLPSLAGKDEFDTYQRELDRRGVELTIRERQFDRKLEENTILGFYYAGEPVSLEQIRAGFKVPKGSKLQAIVSKRSDGMVAMPDLLCQTFEAAKFKLESNELKLGEVYGTRNNQAYVWKQEPAYVAGQRIPTGTTIALHLTAELPAECQ